MVACTNGVIIHVNYEKLSRMMIDFSDCFNSVRKSLVNFLTIGGGSDRLSFLMGKNHTLPSELDIFLKMFSSDFLPELLNIIRK